MNRLIAILFILLTFGSYSFASSGTATVSKVQKKKKVPVTGDDSTVGEVSSGGGSAIVCRDTDGSIIGSPQLLDLYESQFSLPISSDDYVTDYVNAVKRFYELRGQKSLTESRIIKNLGEILSLSYWTQEDEELVLLDDIGASSPLLNLEAGCSREQAAIYVDRTATTDDVVYLDTEIWNAMDSINKAALIVHEKLYKFDRILGETDSFAVRQSVAYLFSSDQFPKTLSGIPEKSLMCTTGYNKERKDYSKRSVFYVYPKANGHMIQFSRIMGRPILRKATIFWKGAFEVKNTVTSAIVNEPGVYRNKNLPLQGSQYTGLSVEVDYKYNESLKISLYREGKLLEKAETSSCLRLN